jgi:phage terminase large subunit-like protein
MDGSIGPNGSRPSDLGDQDGGGAERDRPLRLEAPSSNWEGWPPRWLTPVAPADLERTIGDVIADFAEELVPIAKDSIAGRSGEPLQLRHWQRQLLRHIFALKEDDTFVHRFFLVGIARKNGKTAMASTLPLYFGLFGDHGGEIYSAAADREQAKLVMSHAKRALELSPQLAEHARVYRDAIEFKKTGTVYKALSSEAFTKEGLSATLVIADELAAWPNRELFDVLSLSMGARRSPMMLAITTAGPRVDSTGYDSIAYTLYQLARRRIAGENDDSTLGMAWWEASEDAYADESLWREANPGLISEPAILAMDDLISARKRTPEAEFKTKRLNMWTSSGAAFLPAGTWDECATPGLALTPEDDIVVAFDGSFSNDSTAIVAARIHDGAIFVLGHWERPIDAEQSWRVPVSEVEARMEEICRTHKVREISCDPFRWQRSMQEWEARGLPVVEFPQSPSRMVPATASLYDAVVNKRLKHTGDPSLARHASNATPYVSRNGTMIRKGRDAQKKIDLIVAAIMAYSRATTLSSIVTKPTPKVEYIEL